MQTSTFLTSVVIGTVLAVSSPALAGTKKLKLDTGDLIGIPTTATDGGYLSFADGSATLGGIVFDMPKDHKKDKKAIIRFTMVSSDTGCNFDLVAVGSTRVRVGKVVSGGSGPAGGFAPVVAGVTAAQGTAGKAFTKDFKILPLTSGPLIGLRKGDSVGVVIGRAASVADTCVDGLTITGAQLIYPTP